MKGSFVEKLRVTNGFTIISSPKIILSSWHVPEVECPVGMFLKQRSSSRDRIREVAQEIIKSSWHVPEVEQ